MCVITFCSTYAYCIHNFISEQVNILGVEQFITFDVHISFKFNYFLGLKNKFLCLEASYS